MLRIDAVQFNPAAGNAAERFMVRVVVRNSGTAVFKLKHDAASLLRWFFVAEVYDSMGALLFRDDNMRYHSPFSFDPANWPTLEIAPQTEKGDDLLVNPASGFGTLPAGKYSIRVYFPFEDGKYYPSNLKRFELKKDQRKKEDFEELK